ncbi:MAG TPA: CehA/McbA family metallohydrolase, partial [Gemmatimonadales bacterium]|nr:CehA/McbA family metallohydrolase [Gemmatimonadales bacterium]
MRLARRAALGLLLVCLAPGVVPAQRAPVLRQIKVPHPYYFREMLIPQVTSGPGAATWSPDGRELIYAMQGTLWRQAVGSEEARQITDGPGYDAEPDWSPDGRRLVYASYRNDAVELHLLDLASGATTALVANGAVNIEPRWSPDGSRIAYTSTEYEGRWHIFTVEVGPGPVAKPVRVTEDRDSGLPRYYYGKFDQYLSPTWSPDGRELLVVSNRGHIWGSGGFWRMPASPGGAGREIRYEETTWRASPDWSPDGHRIAYASYLGRQWHQLWLMTADGGDPIQLTYGEFDATAPRWSPAGDRLAYVSNERGNSSLWVVTVHGGGRQEVRPVRRSYLAPVGTLSLRVVDTAGRPMPARVSVRDARDRAYAPDDAWRHADDGFDRAERRLEYGYFHITGRAGLTVPAGTLEVEVSRGPEWKVQRHTVRVEAGRTSTLRVPLRRLADLRGRGWYAGDLHVHMNYGGAYRADPARLAFMARAEDLHLVENLIVNKEGRVPDVGYFRAGPDPVSDSVTLILHGQEYHTSFWGHIGLLGLTEHLILPGYTAYAGTPMATLQPTNSRVAELARTQGALVGYVHPYDAYPDPRDTTRTLTHALPVDAALGLVDYYEALGFVDDPMATLQPTNARVAALARAQGALVGYVHPYDAMPDPADTAR